MKILIAEDDVTSRAVLARVLQNGGHEVVMTADGVEAWEVLQQPDAPKLLFVDWMMPNMDGPELLRRVRSLPAACPPYVIIISTMNKTPDVAAQLEAGANDYLTKPVNLGEVLARVEVGRRMIEMEEVQHRCRAKEQAYRVKTSSRIVELESALDTITEKLKKALAKVADLENERL